MQVMDDWGSWMGIHHLVNLSGNIMKCKFCNKEIVLDEEDGFWDNHTITKEGWRINTPFNCIGDFTHEPDYLLDYYEQCVALIAEEK